MYSAQLGKAFASLLAFVGLACLVTTNIAFYIFFKRNTMKDKAFAEWIRVHTKTDIFVPLLCLLVNFKFIRFTFSGFFAMENCMASFTQPQRAMHRQLKMMTYFSYIFAYIPIFMADILIIVQVGWGHQVLVLAIETFILQLFIIYLTYQEFKDPEKLYSIADTRMNSLRPKKMG